MYFYMQEGFGCNVWDLSIWREVKRKEQLESLFTNILLFFVLIFYCNFI